MRKENDFEGQPSKKQRLDTTPRRQRVGESIKQPVGGVSTDGDKAVGALFTREAVAPMVFVLEDMCTRKILSRWHFRPFVETRRGHVLYPLRDDFDHQGGHTRLSLLTSPQETSGGYPCLCCWQVPSAREGGDGCSCFVLGGRTGFLNKHVTSSLELDGCGITAWR